MHAQNIIVAFIILYRPFVKMLISNDKLKVYMSSNMALDEGALDTANWLRGYIGHSILVYKSFYRAYLY